MGRELDYVARLAMDYGRLLGEVSNYLRYLDGGEADTEWGRAALERLRQHAEEGEKRCAELVSEYTPPPSSAGTVKDGEDE